MTDTPETGDRQAPPGSPPILVDTSGDPPAVEAQGDRQVTGSVILVNDEQRLMPTAGEYRAAGYTVPDHDGGPVPDDQTPGLVYADQRAAEGTVHLVDTPVVLPPPAPVADEVPAAPPAEVPGASGPEPTPAAEADSPSRRRPRG